MEAATVRVFAVGAVQLARVYETLHTDADRWRRSAEVVDALAAAEAT